MKSNETSGVGGVELGNFFEIYPFQKFLGRHLKKYLYVQKFLGRHFFIASMKWHNCSKYSQVTCSIVASSDPASSHPLHCCFSQNSGHGVACLAGCPGCPHKAQESDWNIEKDILVIQKKHIHTPTFRVQSSTTVPLVTAQ